MSITWSHDLDGPVYQELYRDDELIAAPAAGQSLYRDGGLDPNRRYEYRIVLRLDGETIATDEAATATLAHIPGVAGPFRAYRTGFELAIVDVANPPETTYKVTVWNAVWYRNAKHYSHWSTSRCRTFENLPTGLPFEFEVVARNLDGVRTLPVRRTLDGKKLLSLQGIIANEVFTEAVDGEGQQRCQVLEALESYDNESMEALLLISGFTVGALQPVMARSWVKDGLDEIERTALRFLGEIATGDEAAALRILAMPFMEEVDPHDIESLEALRLLSGLSVPALRSLVARPWVGDGLDENEHSVIDRLGKMITREETVAAGIVDMPFLDTVEPVDVSAIESLDSFAIHYPEMLRQIVEHPTLSDGITDEWTHVVVTLHALGHVGGKSRDLLDALLDPVVVTVERRTIDLPLAGPTDLAIVRTRPGSEQSMDILERIVRGMEEYMGLPLPVGHVTVLFVDGIWAYGYNARTYIAARTYYDHDGSSAWIFSHEVAHYYWRGGHGWLVEGPAIFISRALLGDPPHLWSEQRGLAYRYPDTISELERVLSEGPVHPYVSVASHNLGARIFADLYRILGDKAFREGLRRLYPVSVSDGVRAGIDEVKDAFKSAAPDAAAGIDKVAARWYDGSEPHDTSHLDTGPVHPGLAVIGGRIDKAYVAAGPYGSPSSRFSTKEVAGDLRLTLEYSYEQQGAPRQLRFDIVEHFEDGFVFHRRDVIAEAPAETVSHTYHLPVGRGSLKKCVNEQAV